MISGRKRSFIQASLAVFGMALVQPAFGGAVPAAGTPGEPLSMTAPTAVAAPNDHYFSYQWSLSNTGGVNQIVPIDADDYHTIYQQGVVGADIGWIPARSDLAQKATNPVTVAVIDSGVDPTHEDLQGRLAPGAYDFLLQAPVVNDTYGHGTHITGIIVGNADNGVGIAGIAPSSVNVLPLRVLWSPGDAAGTNYTYPNFAQPGTTELISDFVSQAVDYAVQKKASVINLSIVWPQLVDTQKARTSIANAVKAGVLVVVAAGNDRKEQPTFPCSYEGVLCVGSVTNTGKLAIYSNYGGRVDILAPGDGIMSTYPKSVQSQVSGISGYELMSGTSMSAPMVAGVAASLRAIYPQISLNELKARLFVSAQALPSDGASLYGLVNLKGAIDAQPQPVYVPDFKSIDEIAVDEASLQGSGQINVQNLWADATNVNVQVTINGQTAGTATAATLASGDTVTIPWTYKFASLDDSSELKFSVQVTDGSGTSKLFSLSATAARKIETMAGTQMFQIPGVKPTDWVSVNNQHLFPNNLNGVETYPAGPGLPRYYQQTNYGTAGGVMNIYDPSNTATPVTNLKVPGIKGIREVVRIDVLGNGKMDWVIMGLGAPSNMPVNQFTYYEFYFLDPSFNPLFGSEAASEFQVPAQFNQRTGDAFAPGGAKVTRSYAVHGSWVRTTYNGTPMSIPSFLDVGGLPPKDGFGELDPSSQAPIGGQHLYYLSPVAPVAGTAAGSPVQLELRALDNAAFRTQYPYATLMSLIPEPQDDQAARLKILMSNGTLLSSPTLMWDVESLSNANLVPATGWDAVTSNALSFISLTNGAAPSSSAFLSFYGESNRGNVTWVSANGAFVDRSEFQFMSPENPLAGSIGVFDLGATGHYWFLQAGFDFVAYHDGGKVSSGNYETQTLPIDRETSLYVDQFSELFSPVMVGTASAPEPGIYIDTTIVHGDVLAVAAWDPASDTFKRPLRYSMILPTPCLEMNPVQLTSDATSFALPLLCQAGSQLQLEVVKPQ